MMSRLQSGAGENSKWLSLRDSAYSVPLRNSGLN